MEPGDRVLVRPFFHIPVRPWWTESYRWVGRAARCLLIRSFSARPPAEPDVMVSRSSGSPVTTT